jgi:hypothetical protein
MELDGTALSLWWLMDAGYPVRAVVAVARILTGEPP